MRLSRIFGLLALLILFGSRAALAAEALEGRYRGLGEANGAEIVVTPAEGGLGGTFVDAAGRRQSFSADHRDGGAEAVLEMDGRTVVMRMTPTAFGAEVALLPVDADGRLLPDDGRVLAFLHDSLELPSAPEDFMPPPAPGTARIGAYSFLASYEFWEAEGVRDGYLALAPRHRTLIRLFAPVQLDIIWKLCLAPEADQALGTALRGQGVTCDEVRSVIAATQRSGRFDAYKAEVAAAGDALRQAVRCGDFYVETKAACDAAAREVSKTATSLETAASVLARYR